MQLVILTTASPHLYTLGLIPENNQVVLYLLASQRGNVGFRFSEILRRLKNMQPLKSKLNVTIIL